MTKQAVSLPPEAETHQLINAKQLRQMCPVSLLSFWRWEKDGRWPKRIKINGRNFWRLSEVRDAIDQLSVREE